MDEYSSKVEQGMQKDRFVISGCYLLLVYYIFVTHLYKMCKLH